MPISPVNNVVTHLRLSSGLRQFYVCCVLVFLATGVSAQISPTLEKIRETGIVVVGHRIGSIPFSYLDDTLKPIGYTIDLCQRVVDSLAQTLARPLIVKRVAVTPATRIPLVVNGTLDLECGVTTNTLERQKNLSFALTTFVTHGRLLSKKSSNIQSLADLKNQLVVSTTSTTNMQFLNDANRNQQLNMKILAGKDDAESFQMVDTGRAVAYAMDDVLLRSLVVNSGRPDGFMISRESLSVEPYAIGLNRHDPVFKKAVDAALMHLFKSGEIHILYRRWFESPIPPKGINLQLPMSAALKRVIASPTDSGNPSDYAAADR
jgi:glutamate/aspartate transport system substrate-binding protein